MIIKAILFFIAGYYLFPILFFFQRKLKLPIPNLEKKKFHIHHSLYGLILNIIGIVTVITGKVDFGLLTFFVGLGFVVHHKVSEPHWRGIANFIYIEHREHHNKLEK